MDGSDSAGHNRTTVPASTLAGPLLHAANEISLISFGSSAAPVRFTRCDTGRPARRVLERRIRRIRAHLARDPAVDVAGIEDDGHAFADERARKKIQGGHYIFD